jgi:predicted O-methyltransferase YrrM
MNVRQAQRITDFLAENRLSDCLELGFFHGVSSAYIADSLRTRGSGHLTTIDLDDARKKEPNIDKILADLDLTDWVTVYYEPRSFTWRLMKFIEESSQPRFDFCYLDGGHTWDASGFAFFLVERLLRPGGWLLFDDLNWSVAPEAEALQRKGKSLPGWMARMTEEERRTKQVRNIWELLVKRHDGFDEFFEEGQWGFARKKVDKAAHNQRGAINRAAGRVRVLVRNRARGLLSSLKQRGGAS